MDASGREWNRTRLTGKRGLQNYRREAPLMLLNIIAIQNNRARPVGRAYLRSLAAPNFVSRQIEMPRAKLSATPENPRSSASICGSNTKRQPRPRLFPVNPSTRPGGA
jgi:hypothetical protein